MGEFPWPENGMVVRISLPQSKRWKRDKPTLVRARKGSITHKDLGKLISELSFAQTSVFGRFGRTLLIHLHGELNDALFRPRFTRGDFRS